MEPNFIIEYAIRHFVGALAGFCAGLIFSFVIQQIRERRMVQHRTIINEREKGENMKYLLILFILLIPHTISIDCHHAFDSLSDQFKFHQIRMYHGNCFVASDFSHAIRLNGERIKLK